MGWQSLQKVVARGDVGSPGASPAPPAPSKEEGAQEGCHLPGLAPSAGPGVQGAQDLSGQGSELMAAEVCFPLPDSSARPSRITVEVRACQHVPVGLHAPTLRPQRWAPADGWGLHQQPPRYWVGGEGGPSITALGAPTLQAHAAPPFFAHTGPSAQRLSPAILLPYPGFSGCHWSNSH